MPISVSQKPSRCATSGMCSKFMPKMPVISVSGAKIAVMTVSVRTIWLVRCALAEKCSWTAVSIAVFQAARVVEHAAHVLEHVGDAHQERVALLCLRRGLEIAVAQFL